jgi:hypothetical protein
MGQTALLWRCMLSICLAVAWSSASTNAAEWVPSTLTRIIHFAGQDWYVKDSAGRSFGPGPAVFDGGNVEVRQGQLHLRVSRRNGQWSSAEVVSKASFGYGRYSFRVGSEVADLDPNVVLGLFTWSDDPAFSHREIDIEISRWGSSSASDPNAQCVVQPYERPGAIVSFAVPPGLKDPIYTFTWTPDAVTCEIVGGTGPSSFRFAHRFTDDIPEAGGENARINLWQLGGQPPARGQGQEVVIAGFSFTPLSALPALAPGRESDK